MRTWEGNEEVWTKFWIVCGCPISINIWLGETKKWCVGLQKVNFFAKEQCIIQQALSCYSIRCKVFYSILCLSACVPSCKTGNFTKFNQNFKVSRAENFLEKVTFFAHHYYIHMYGELPEGNLVYSRTGACVGYKLME